MTQAERLSLLRSALAEVLPESREWPLQSASPDSHGNAGEYWFDVPSAVRPERQRLVVLLRPDGDVQVEYHMVEMRGSPFEALFPIPEGQEAEVLGQVARFIEGLLKEQLVLAMDPRFWRGGRHFLPADQLGETPEHRLSWVTSWRGTYDRRL